MVDWVSILDFKSLFQVEGLQHLQRRSGGREATVRHYLSLPRVGSGGCRVPGGRASPAHPSGWVPWSVARAWWIGLQLWIYLSYPCFCCLVSVYTPAQRWFQVDSVRTPRDGRHTFVDAQGCYVRS